MSLSELYTIISAGYEIFRTTEFALLVQIFQFCVEIVSKLSEWPMLFVAAFAPWFTRLYATALHTKETDMASKVEESIVRLLNRDEPSAIQKGELMQSLWEVAQRDQVTPGDNRRLQANLSKRYTIVGQKEPLSFWEVASTRRVDDVLFEPKAPDTRFSFFGLRGRPTTMSELKPFELAMS